MTLVVEVCLVNQHLVLPLAEVLAEVPVLLAQLLQLLALLEVLTGHLKMRRTSGLRLSWLMRTSQML